MKRRREPLNVLLLNIGWIIFMGGIGGGMAQSADYSTGAYFMLAGVTIMGSAFLLIAME